MVHVRFPGIRILECLAIVQKSIPLIVKMCHKMAGMLYGTSITLLKCFVQAMDNVLLTASHDIIIVHSMQFL